MNRFQMIALDVDGTLLTDDHTLLPQTKKTVQAVAAQGAEIVLCTGRSPSSTIPLMEMLELEGTVITHNGSVIVETKSREVIHQFVISPAQLAPYQQYCREHGYHFDLNTAFHLYVEDAGVLTEEVLEMYGKFYIEPLVLPKEGDILNEIVKMTVAGTKDEMDRLESEWATWTHELTIIRSGDYFIDIMNPEASKGNALKALSSRRGVEVSRVMALGNYYNDITMLQFAGVGIAMDNSPLEVKAAADDVAPSNNEGGVHFALTKYCM